MVSKERKRFNANSNDMYTILDVMLAKYGEDSREFQGTMDYFVGMATTYLCHLDYETMLAHAKKLLTVKVLRGGSAKMNSGKKKLPEVATILRKFAHLAAAITFMVKKGIPLENHAIKVVAYLRELDKKVKNGKATGSAGRDETNEDGIEEDA